MRVLVVDGSAVMRSMLIRTLQRSGLPLVSVSQAAGGREALDLLGKEAFDLVLVDRAVPGMPATDLVEAILADPTGQATVVVIGDGGPLPPGAARLGALRKPFTPDDVRRAVLSSVGAGKPGAP